MRTHKIAALGGDGIGPEVVEAGLEVLAVCAERDGGFALDVERFDWGSDYYRKHGVMMPADGADRLRAFDAILFGAVGAPRHPRPHHAVGLAPRYLPAARPIRQC